MVHLELDIWGGFVVVVRLGHGSRDQCAALPLVEKEHILRCDWSRCVPCYPANICTKRGRMLTGPLDWPQRRREKDTEGTIKKSERIFQFSN